MTSPVRSGPLRVLFLCTGNSARSQMAEAILNPIEKLEHLALEQRMRSIGRIDSAAEVGGPE